MWVLKDIVKNMTEIFGSWNNPVDADDGDVETVETVETITTTTTRKTLPSVSHISIKKLYYIERKLLFKNRLWI